MYIYYRKIKVFTVIGVSYDVTLVFSHIVVIVVIRVKPYGVVWVRFDIIGIYGKQSGTGTRFSPNT
jgi:hypothetical protein